MSDVTNVIIVSSSVSNRPAMMALGEIDERRKWRGAFGSVTDDPSRNIWIHDGKAPECQVWVGAFNHLNRPALLHDLATLPWDDRGAVQILIAGQEDDCFGLWMFQGYELIEVPLPGTVRVPEMAWTTAGYELPIGRLERTS